MKACHLLPLVFAVCTTHAGSILDDIGNLRTMIRGTKLPGSKNDKDTVQPRHKHHNSRLEINENNPTFPKPEAENTSTTSSPSTTQGQLEMGPTTKPPDNYKVNATKSGNEAWDRFKAQWENIALFHKSQQLSRQDKLEFLKDFKRTETIRHLTWPASITMIATMVLVLICSLCCCVKRAVYCCGKQFCDFSKNSALNYNEAKSMEMKTIIRPAAKKMTDDDARKIAYYIRTKANHPEILKGRPTGSVSFSQEQARAIVHTQQATPRPMPDTPLNEHTYSNQTISCAGSISTLAGGDSTYDTAN